ncbi:uncharacterized protein LOC101864092 [Aplysia californica]|uniref:Uncharacterized protein LOC101864092 n=1 Tax=Aplysia californica TaxID=6500 RepID=A0ABM0K3J2_APLCA|nr:uncharacterized protein LOC101864092 [Aplysia californica]
MKILVAFSCLLAAACAYYSGSSFGRGPWSGPLVVSRRNAEAPGVASLVADVNAMLEKAKKGIKADDLEKGAENIGEAAEAIKEAEGGEENTEDVKKLIDDVANTFNGATAVSALFDGPLDFESSKLDSALNLLNGLSQEAQELSAAGKPLTDVMSAIEMTAGAIEDITEDAVDMVVLFETAKEEEKQEDGEEKRSSGYRTRRGTWKAGLSYGNGGLQGGVSYSWNGKR